MTLGPIGCSKCGHLACVCRVLAEHFDGCPFRLSATCAVEVACDHGRAVCPECDPCTCRTRGSLRNLMMGRDEISSDGGKYRWWLTRHIQEPLDPFVGDEWVVFVMLNPSTATASQDDPTIRRCVGFAKAWGFSHLGVVNLWGVRATDPKELLSVSDWKGEVNARYIETAINLAALTVCAWGANRQRIARVLGAPNPDVRALAGNMPLSHLGLTKDGEPRHPLYLPKTTQPLEWVD